MEEMVRRSDACWTTGGGRGSGDEATLRLSSVWRGSMIRGATALLVGNEDAADFRDSKERWRWRRGSGGCRQLWCRVEMRQCVWQWRRERLVVEVSRWGEDIGIGADYGLWRRLRLMAPNPRGGAWPWKGVGKRKKKKKKEEGRRKKEEDEELAVACLILSPDICFKICAVRKEKQGLVKIIFYIIKNIKYN